MKDATGELSMTAIAVVAIAAISVLFSTLIWPQIRSNILRSTHCSNVAYCDACEPTDKTCTCYYYADDNGNDGVDEGTLTEIQCSNNAYTG